MFFALFLIGLATTPKAFAAACCGGGFALPSLIAGDDRGQVTFSLGHNETRTQVDSQGFWMNSPVPEHRQSLRLEGAFLLSDRWQAGLSLPFSQSQRGGFRNSGLGDVSASAGYEYLPDWDYHPWRPRGLGFIQLTAPTGSSVYDSSGDIGVHGRGFWSFGAGTLLSKIRGPWDFFILTELRKSMPRTIKRGSEDLTLSPGWAGDLGFGFGFNTMQWRWGSSLTWSAEGAGQLRGSRIDDESSPQRWATANLNVSYIPRENWAATLSLQDQSLFGDPLNTGIGRGVSILLQHRWSR